LCLGSQKEWLCLNCQTQRALSGQLGDSGKIPTPTPVPAKPEIQTTPAIKMEEPKTAPTKVEPTIGATEPQITMATIPSTLSELDTTPMATTAKVSIAAAEKQPLPASTAEPFIDVTMQKAEVAPKAEVPNSKVPKTTIIENKDTLVKFPKAQGFKPELTETGGKADVSTASSVSVAVVTDVPIPLIAAEIAVSEVVRETETKSELSDLESVIEEEQPDDHIKLIEPTKSLAQVESQPMSQEQQLTVEAEPDLVADRKELAERTIEKITDIATSSEEQPVSTETIILKVRMDPSLLKYFSLTCYEISFI